MTPEAQRIAIAEACGWKLETRSMYGGTKNVKGWGFNGRLSLGHAERKFITYVDSFPDYLNDLNAMHEAEKVLKPHQWSEWATTMRKIIMRECDKPECHLPIELSTRSMVADFWFYHATAAQRAEAFLKTLNLWQS